jgi:hypothetical protein
MLPQGSTTHVLGRGDDPGACRDYTARPNWHCPMEINPIKSEITALQARFNALRGYL